MISPRPGRLLPVATATKSRLQDCGPNPFVLKEGCWPTLCKGGELRADGLLRCSLIGKLWEESPGFGASLKVGDFRGWWWEEGLGQ